MFGSHFSRTLSIGRRDCAAARELHLFMMVCMFEDMLIKAWALSSVNCISSFRMRNASLYAFSELESLFCFGPCLSSTVLDFGGVYL